MWLVLTKKLIANIVLSDELSKKLFVFAIFVGYLGQQTQSETIVLDLHGEETPYCGIPECTAKLDGFEKNWLGLLVVKISP